MICMLPFEAIAELFEIVTSERSQWPWARGKPPSAASVRQIEVSLGIRIPDEFQRLAATCPSYASWLASIGDDFASEVHLLKLNQLYHANILEEDGYAPLPEHYVMLNHGYDGDCDCWDTRVVTEEGEHPIVYVSVDNEVTTIGKRFETFREYAKSYVLSRAADAPDPRARKRALEIIKQWGEDSGRGRRRWGSFCGMEEKTS
ncbi:MAG TPA: SMI1/KNR4 family protein [Verrucomicrobiae bacterium]